MTEHWRTKPRVQIVVAALPWVLVAAMGVWVFSSMAQDLLGVYLGFNFLAFTPAFYILLFGLWTSVGIRTVARHAAWQHIISSDFNACPRCEYLLRGLPAAARCPECGELYEVDSVQAHWKACLKNAQEHEACLCLSLSSMQRYTRYSIWMFVIAAVCMGIGVLDDYYRFIPGRITWSLFMFAGCALLIAQQTLLTRTIRKFWDGEMKR